ncbi:hypothetical protein N7492_004462 [Penicillium capsulatum]|uniref:Cytochrome P450 n=1 Tax=Penicillium capsulatum TaxID=69766 RepID=A0A9W9I7N8_9EURO|nr:hypothetical protein N7492_004462 [Penicillium capsulatum]KAJ6136418.1 hypothetical protein N7512_001578 [Penicillium capsulatum]
MAFVIGLLSTLVGIISVYLLAEILHRKSRGRLPPGPRGYPLVGNIWGLPAEDIPQWIYWLQHKTKYGPISSVTVMGQNLVIVNDAEIAHELLQKRSAIHSSRPKFTLAGEMVGWEQGLVFQTYSETFRAYRKAMQPGFGSHLAVKQFDSLQELECRRFLLRTLRDPANFVQHIQTEGATIILDISYGYRVDPFKPDHFVRSIGTALDEFAIAAQPGTWLVDIFPILKHVPSWCPGAGFKRSAAVWRERAVDLTSRPYAFAKAQFQSGKYRNSFLANIFENGIPEPGSQAETIAKWTAVSLFAAGVETTVSTVECFFLAMAMSPEIQRRAQEEIDRVVGSDRLPTVADRPRLPYIEAILKETLRWHQVAPMAAPHVSTADDYWEGYLIPKGSLILPNVWAMAHDPDVYPDPMTFNPDRFLGDNPAPDPRTVVFGFGRRICPGRFFVDNTVFLDMAQALAVFDISNATRDGVPVVTPEFTPGVVSHPQPFQCDIKVRSSKHESLILSVEKEHSWEPSDAEALQSIVGDI